VSTKTKLFVQTRCLDKVPAFCYKFDSDQWWHAYQTCRWVARSSRTCRCSGGCVGASRYDSRRRTWHWRAATSLSTCSTGCGRCEVPQGRHSLGPQLRRQQLMESSLGNKWTVYRLQWPDGTWPSLRLWRVTAWDVGAHRWWNITRKLCYRKDDCEPLRRYCHSKLSKMAAAAVFNLFESKIAPLDPPSPKTPP